MADLYRRAKEGQWNGDTLPWNIDVDPMNPEVPLLPEEFLDLHLLEEYGAKLSEKEKREVQY
ncbi:hypothetical protein, partial [Aeromonas sp. EERV15]|uniref:hypothetical protein n=1 Tax=Aeromonas sp. EERV15 TaxID=1833892 RepID=UPI001C40007A